MELKCLDFIRYIIMLIIKMPIVQPVNRSVWDNKMIGERNENSLNLWRDYWIDYTNINWTKNQKNKKQKK